MWIIPLNISCMKFIEASLKDAIYPAVFSKTHHTKLYGSSCFLNFLQIYKQVTENLLELIPYNDTKISYLEQWARIPLLIMNYKISYHSSQSYIFPIVL